MKNIFSLIGISFISVLSSISFLGALTLYSPRIYAHSEEKNQDKSSLRIDPIPHRAPINPIAQNSTSSAHSEHSEHFELNEVSVLSALSKTGSPLIEATGNMVQLDAEKSEKELLPI
jgi:hypothetical protein